VTEKEAKDKLPRVRVKMPDTEYMGQTKGRKCTFATVCINFSAVGQIDFQTSWKQIADCVTNDKPIVYC